MAQWNDHHFTKVLIGTLIGDLLVSFSVQTKQLFTAEFADFSVSVCLEIVCVYFYNVFKSSSFFCLLKRENHVTFFSSMKSEHRDPVT